ncbi:efflux RND transporter permease subunit [Tanticharoenia sakaeratensis]|uniref:Acriflavin resistance protein F n=1 Tax=Tanticharoenia sakaeratensis NBRC 103193 TaxID=1231623 RepID=A0A0D6MJ02_9PROT|nr:efflux RND transporter permease subunit [Tanticharoenia sakaeratensis]GAN53639.1 acriflavin resistance protein F [Tanticharoenia sakaeratensis NBRC 103193]GBQ17309.1 multidrug efflux pump acriflavin resistance protein AcrB/AcrD/AcrF [Tanticharoenia sakaeratensis NBRC 103193]
MNPARLFITRPVATTLLTAALLIGGVLGYTQLPVADLPNVDFPVISVHAQQAGGSPSEIASTIAEPLERHLGAIADLTEMTSQSMVNQTRITLQFSLSRDINGAARDVEAALQAAHADLPSSLRQNPAYSLANSNGPPIMVLSLTSPTRTQAQLFDLGTNVLQQQLEQVQGVGDLEVGGSALPAVRVEVNPLQLYKYGIGFEDLRANLASANAHSPKGFIEAGNTRYMLDVNDQATQAEAYKDLVIAYRDNAAVHLADVAQVFDSVENLRNAGWYSRDPAIIITIFSQAGANVIKTSDEIKSRFKLIQAALPPDVQLHIAIDRSLTIRSSLADTKATLVIAVALVVAVVLIFLRSFRAIVIPAIVVPVSIIATFGAMALMGYQLDNMSLMALTISTGFVVDDAIVVLENITRYIEMGHSRFDAALLGSQEVAFTVVSITASLIAVFMPIMLLGGIAGRLFHEFAMTISISLVISMVLSLSLTPMLCAMILPDGDHERPHSKISLAVERVLDGITNAYAASLDVTLRHRFLTVLSLPATLVLAGVLFVKMPKGFFPTEDTGLLMGHLMGDQDISFTAMKTKMDEAMRGILKDRDVDGVAAFLGGRSANEGNLFIQLQDKGKRTDEVSQTIQRISRRLSHMVGAQMYLMEPGAVRAGARSSNAAYQYSLQSSDADALYEWTPKLVNALKAQHELMDISSDMQQGGSALSVSIHRDTEARVQLTPQLVSNILYDAYGQRAASIIYKPLNQYRVVMEAAPRFWRDPTSLRQVWISTSGGTASGSSSSNTIRVQLEDSTSTTASAASSAYANEMANSLAGGNSASTGAAVSTSAETMVPLTLVGSIKPTTTPLTVNHQGQAVATTVSFNLSPGVSLGTAVTVIHAAMAKLHMPKTIQGGFAGNAAMFQSSLKSEPLLIGAALIAVYVVLGILYESTVHPLTILSTLPSAGVGALLFLQLFGEDFSLIAMIGVILLIGIVKKNAILLVDFAIQARREGMSAHGAIREASVLRFRPIIMTSLAAALGAVPLVIGNGYGSELRHPLGLSILGGLLVSQLLTLYSTPVVYLYLEQFGEAVRRGLHRISKVLSPTRQDISPG